MELHTTVIFLLLLKIAQCTKNVLKEFNQIEDQNLNNKMCTGTNVLFQKSSFSPMLCSMFCKAEVTCFGVFYEAGTKSCVGCKGVNALEAKAGTILLSEHNAEHCDAGWNRNDLSCYFFSTFSGDILMSQQYCDEKGAHLVHLDSEEEFQYLKGQNNGQHRWIGLTDQTTESRWVTLGTNTMPSYEPPWFPGEPNNGRGGNCAHMWSDRDNQLADDDCTRWHHFICEIELYSTCR